VASAQGCCAHALLRQMLERGDIVIGQQCGELIAAVEGQDGVERIEFLGPLQNSLVANRCRRGFLCHLVCPVTHSPPSDPGDAIEIPPATKRRLGLDDERSWIVLTESNRFVCQGQM
jgi:hypothetical protein